MLLLHKDVDTETMYRKIFHLSQAQLFVYFPSTEYFTVLFDVRDFDYYKMYVGNLSIVVIFHLKLKI